MRLNYHSLLFLSCLVLAPAYAVEDMSCTDVGITGSNMYLSYWKGQSVFRIVEENVEGKSMRDKEIVYFIGDILPELDSSIPKSKLRNTRNAVKKTMRQACQNGDFD